MDSILDQETFYDIRTEEKEKKHTRYFDWLKLFSLGQYRTPLYYKKSDSQSSICGGIVTIFGFVLIVTFAFVTLLPIFNKKRHIFNQESKQLQLFNYETGKISTCNVNECMKLTNR